MARDALCQVMREQDAWAWWIYLVVSAPALMCCARLVALWLARQVLGPRAFWGKVFCEEGVIFEKDYPTKAEAEAYATGAMDMIAAADPEDDTLSAGVSTMPARDPDQEQGRERHEAH